MGKFLKRIAILAFAGGLLYGASYVGARAKVGTMLGETSRDMGERSIRFVWDGVQTLPGKPRAWEFTYSQARIYMSRPVMIYISPTGQILGTVPADLDRRLDAVRAQDP